MAGTIGFVVVISIAVVFVAVVFVGKDVPARIEWAGSVEQLLPTRV